MSTRRVIAHQQSVQWAGTQSIEMSACFHTSDNNSETPMARAPYLGPLDCNRPELTRLPLGRATLLGIPEVVGILRREVDVAVEYNGTPFVVRRPSTPLSLAKPTEPLSAPVSVVSYLEQI